MEFLLGMILGTLVILAIMGLVLLFKYRSYQTGYNDGLSDMYKILFEDEDLDEIEGATNISNFEEFKRKHQKIK